MPIALEVSFDFGQLDRAYPGRMAWCSYKDGMKHYTKYQIIMKEYEMRIRFLLLSHFVLDRRINVLRICEFNVSGCKEYHEIRFQKRDKNLLTVINDID